MTRVWARSVIDMRILEKLYDYKSLRGTTLAKICTPENYQKTYDRLNALVKLGKLESKIYMEQCGRVGRNKIDGFKNRGQMYFLTGEGVTAVKQYRGQPTQETERGIEVLDTQLKPLYTASLIIENIALPFRDGRSYKAENDLANYITVDLQYNNWLIFVERTQTSYYRQKQCKIVKGLKDDEKHGNVIIITPNETKAAITAKTWKENSGPDVRIMSLGNMRGIERLLTDRTPAEVLDAISINKGYVTKLAQPDNGYTHAINGERYVVKDIIGYSPKTMRYINASNLEGKKKIIVAETAQLPLVARYFPTLLKPEHEFITLDGECKTSEELQRDYGRKRKKQYA